MCNGYNHPPGCTCGWGGEGRLGHEGGAGFQHRNRSSGIQGHRPDERWHNKSMIQLACDLGHSLLFPVLCKYCGSEIYLFADPNGGFAVFNDVGPPWPKHGCYGMRSGPATYSIPPAAFYPRFDMPVPLTVGPAPYRSGEALQGAVVWVRAVSAPRLVGGAFDVALYNGRALFLVRTRQGIQIGKFIAGRATFVPEIGTCLEAIENLDPTTEGRHLGHRKCREPS